MNDSGAVHARLRAHGLLDEAMEIVSRHACGVGVPSPAARDELVAMIKKHGWSEGNAMRLLGVQPSPPPELNAVDDEIDERLVAAPPPAPKSKTRLLGPPRARKESGVHLAVARDTVDERPDAPQAEASVGLKKGQLRRTVGGKVVTITEPRTSSGRARVRYPSGNALEFSIESLEALPIVTSADDDGGPFRHLPLAQRPRLFPGPGDRYEQCIHHGDCLDRMLQAFTREAPLVAHCPKGCKHRRELTRAERVDAATVRSRSIFDG